MREIEFKVGERYNSNKVYASIAHVWSHMINRCYNPECPEYKYYGALGIEVDDRWHDFNDFLKDVDFIEGWDLEKFKNKEIVLDKDIKVKGNKKYSKDLCKWVTKEENLGFLPTRSKKNTWY